MAKGSIEPTGSEEALRDKVAATETRADHVSSSTSKSTRQSSSGCRAPIRGGSAISCTWSPCVAVLLWLGIVVAGSILAVAALGHGACWSSSSSSRWESMVILAWGSTTKQDALLHILAIAAERGMPLAPAVAAFADQYRGLEHRRIMNLAARLNWGAPLPEALEGVARLVTRDATLLAWVGQAAGLLPKALRIAAETRSSQLPIWTSIAARLAYILVLMLGMQGISGFVLYYIVPKFEAIFNDFGLPLPNVTIMVIQAAHFFVRFGAVTAFVPMIEVGS